MTWTVWDCGEKRPMPKPIPKPGPKLTGTRVPSS